MTESNWRFGEPENKPRIQANPPRGLRFFAVVGIAICLIVLLGFGAVLGAGKLISTATKKQAKKINNDVATRTAKTPKPVVKKTTEDTFVWFDDTGKMIVAMDVNSINLDPVAASIAASQVKPTDTSTHPADTSPPAGETPVTPKPVTPEPTPPPPPPPVNHPPTVHVYWSGSTTRDASGCARGTWIASASDPDGDSVSLAWTSKSMEYTSPGYYSMSCTATDSRGASGSGSGGVNIN